MRINNGEPPNFTRTNSPITRPKSPNPARDPSRIVSTSDLPRSPLVHHEDSPPDYSRYPPVSNGHASNSPPTLNKQDAPGRERGIKENETAAAVPQNYDNHKLKSERLAQTLPNGISPLPSEGEPEGTSEDDVVRRIKSPSPKEDAVDGPLASPPLTKTEVKQLKQYNKEPLINKSATIHTKRNALYSEIDLLDSSSSESSSRPSSLHSILSNNSINSDQLYDVPRGTTGASSSNYDTLPPTRPIIPERNSQDFPKGHTLNNNSKRALPHLPTDYVNVNPAIMTSKFVPQSDDLYSVIPDSNRPMSSVLPTVSPVVRHTPSPGSATMIRRVQSPSASMAVRPVLSPIGRPLPFPATNRPLPSPGGSGGDPVDCCDPSTLMKGAKLFDELEEAGYEVFKSAPPICGNVKLATYSTSSEMSDEVGREHLLLSPEDNQYIEITRNKSHANNGYETVADFTTPELLPRSHSRESRPQSAEGPPAKDHEYVNVSRAGRASTITGDILLTTPTTDGSTSADSVGKEQLSNTDTATPDISMDTVTPDISMDTVTSDIGNDSDLQGRPDSSNDIDQELMAIHNDIIVTDEEDMYVAMHSAGGDEDTYVAMQSASSVGVATKDVDLSTRTASIDLDSPRLLESPSPHSPSHSPPTLTAMPHPHTLAIPMPRPQQFLVPVAAGSPPVGHPSLARKRSLTIGDPLDIQETKKHTYVNIPDDRIVTSTGGGGSFPRSRSVESPPCISGEKKRPMPLPKPEKGFLLDKNSGAISNNSTCNNNKVTTLVRQFSNGGSSSAQE